MFDHSILENPTRDLWDSFLTANSLGNLWQIMDYGEYVEKLRPGALTETFRLISSRKGVPEGVALGTCTFWGLSKYHRCGTTMIVREGPLLSVKRRDRLGPLKSVITGLEDLGAKNRIMNVEIWWPYKWGYADLFRNMGYKNVGTNITYTVDLEGGPKHIWTSICGNKRRNIKKAIDSGVEFVESSDFHDIEKFYDLLVKVAERHKSVPEPLSAFQTIWKLPSQKDSSKLFFARWNGNDVSGVFVTTHAKTIYALGFGYNGESLKVRPNDFLHWKIMEWGCKRGFLKYHMGDVFPKNGLSTGIWRWKREWNGDLNYAYIFRKSISKFGFIEHVYDRLQKLV
jgi:hypothetical protein